MSHAAHEAGQLTTLTVDMLSQGTGELDHTRKGPVPVSSAGQSAPSVWQAEAWMGRAQKPMLQPDRDASQCLEQWAQRSEVLPRQRGHETRMNHGPGPIQKISGMRSQRTEWLHHTPEHSTTLLRGVKVSGTQGKAYSVQHPTKDTQEAGRHPQSEEEKESSGTDLEPTHS